MAIAERLEEERRAALAGIQRARTRARDAATVEELQHQAEQVERVYREMLSTLQQGTQTRKEITTMDIESLDYQAWKSAVDAAGANDDDTYSDFANVLEEELHRAEVEAVKAVQIDLQERGNGRFVNTGQVHAVTVNGKTVTMSVGGGSNDLSSEDLQRLTKDPEAGQLYARHLKSTVYDPEQGALVKAAARFRVEQAARNSETLQAQCRAELSKIPRSDMTGKRQQTILKYAKMGMSTSGL